MIKITLVFYQFPEANHELENWEKSQEGKIHKEVIDNKGRIVYTMINKDEKLYCFDINNFFINEIHNVFFESRTGSRIISYIYNKTLIFGKVGYVALKKIEKLLFKYEIENV